MADSTSPILNNLGPGQNTASTPDGNWVKPFVAAAKVQTVDLGYSQPVVDSVLDTLIVNQATLVTITADAFVAIVSHLALNQEDQAKLVYLATSATFAERMATLDADDAAAAKAKADNDAMWSLIRQIALDLLEAAAKAAIPILIAAL
jgi:hypothetical protein